uniref:C2 domain-containing protein n=1 Tax=Caenorhabditis japonica TaxID=281687 RepID=A0A8R1E179_CAEJA
MRPRNAPIYVRSLAENGPKKEDFDPFAEVQLEKVIKELSFIRIQLDDVIIPSANSQIQKLCNSRQLYGFQLEYSFPCLDAVSKALKATVRIPEKFMTATKIEFKHKRVVLLSMHEDQIEHWKKSRLLIHLLVQMSVNGKHTTRPLAKCSIPLHEIIIAPYMIYRDFDFVGPDFEATALIRIDLGSRVKSLMERLEVLRGDRSLENTFVVTDRHHDPAGRRTRSRSSSRCRAHSSATSRDDVTISERENLRPVDVRRPHSSTSSLPNNSAAPIRRFQDPRVPTTANLTRDRTTSSLSSLGSDSVFIRPESLSRQPRVQEVEEPIHRKVSNSLGASTVGNIVDEISYGGKYYVQLTCHEATGLPPVPDENGLISAPSTFISVGGREGELRSPVVPNTRVPRWEFTARFAISSERRNLMIRVNHRGFSGDIPLGFVSIPLPVVTTRKAVFEMADVTQMNRFTSDVPMLTISLERIHNIDDPEDVRRRTSSRIMSARSTQSSPLIPHHYPPSRAESPLITESSEAIKGRMHRCMAELESMLMGINM